MSLLTTFDPSLKAAVFGASGGIGHALVQRLSDDAHIDVVAALSREKPAGLDRHIPWFAFDLLSEDSVTSAVQDIENTVGALDLVLVATGVLQDGERTAPEKTIKALSADAMDHSFKINAIGPALIAKHIGPVLRKDRKTVLAFLSARVGSISDNHLGGWYSYRASKAALHMIVRTTAIELARTHPNTICVSLHPGTVRTALSAPFVSAKTSSAVSPDAAAENLLTVVNGLEQDQSGRIWDWQGAEIDP